MTPEQVDRLITFGQMALEQGWYDQARDYFEQALALDASNREAMKGLARVNEVLSRKAATPTQTEPVKPPRKVATKRTGMYGLAAIFVLTVIVILVWIAYIMFIESRREVAVAPTAAAISTEIPEPTPTLKPLPTSTAAAVTGILFGESIQRQIYSDLVGAVSSNVGDKAYETVAQQWGTTVDVVKAIAVEGFKKNWVTPTPVPTHTPQPTAAPPRETTMPSEEAYRQQLCKITETYARVVSGLFGLVGAGGAVGYSQKPEELLEEEFPWSFSIGASRAYPPVPSRWEEEVASYVSAYQEWVELEGKMLRTLEPPASYQDAHQELVQATKQIDHAVVFLLEVTGEVNAIYKSIRDDRSAQATKAFENVTPPVTPGAVSLIIYDEEVSEANTERLRQAEDKLKQVAVEMYTWGLVLFSTPICDRR